MKLSTSQYTTLVFDCDGVVLNSNSVKTQAFYQVTLPYGETAAQAMVDYHVAHGGISRYKKFAHFLEHIVPDITPGAKSASANGPGLDVLLECYAHEVRQGLLTCDVAPGLRQLRRQTPNARWLIVSGGDQSELRDVFARRRLTDMFDGGIFGSPDAKDLILKREIAEKNIEHPALFIGDSKYDYQVAKESGLEFLFLSDWSEVTDWAQWVADNRLSHASSLRGLI